jgi:intracellular sulfur oxidation DsrE/DsrF family protein
MDPDSIDQPAGTDRRDAIRHLAGGAMALMALGSVACAPAATAASPTPSPAPGTKSAFDMSWLRRVDKRRRMVFDTIEVMSGAGLGFVAAYLSGARDAYGDPDASTVLVHRHASVPIVLGDDIWRRLELGGKLKMKDPATGEPALRNPFIGYTKEDKFSPTGAEAGLDTLMKNGTIVLACNRALTGYAYQLATKEKIDREQAKKELFAALIPGVYVVPNGVFGVCAAQEAGCGYILVH